LDYIEFIAGLGPQKLDELDILLLEDQNVADRLLEVGSRPIRILVTGKTGTGKSSLINGLTGDNVTEEGSSLDPTTTKVEQFKRTVRGVPMLVFDSPGLQDGTENEKEYLLDMERKCKKVDLVLYTMKMTEKRLHVHSEDVEAMKKLTNAFGPNFWERSMFVMTFANEIRNPEKPDDENENRITFEESLHRWIEKLPVIVEKDLHVSKEVARSIPVVPAGYYKNIHLPGRKYWFSRFWKSALYRMREYSDEGYSFMLHFNRDRFKREHETTQEELAEKDLHEQPIIWPDQTSTLSETLLRVFVAIVGLLVFTVLLMKVLQCLAVITMNV
jgi:predicted GTPase